MLTPQTPLHGKWSEVLAELPPKRDRDEIEWAQANLIEEFLEDLSRCMSCTTSQAAFLAQQP